MEYTLIHLQRLVDFCNKIKFETYPEGITELHSKITESNLNQLGSIMQLNQHSKVLDIGCGQAVAKKYFDAFNCKPIGITINQEDIDACRQKGYDVRDMDQSFLDFADNTFDLIWARHVLEHSIFPFFTLHEFYRTLKTGGIAYIELPAPDTAVNHQNNPNHYSVLTSNGWKSLMQRTGFTILHFSEFDIHLAAGMDKYFMFFLQK